MNCWVCDNNDRFDALPEWERIAADEYWRVAHAIDTALPGWLVLIPRRHVTSIADLTDAEAADLGAWQVRLSRALGTVTGCMKTYVVQFAEKEGVSHVHFHVVPRMADLPDDRRGGGVFGYLDPSRELRVGDEHKSELTLALRAHLQAVGTEPHLDDVP
ncbi:HIT family protein [Micromonospora sp. BL4]|uniref:HIT family protein n=1 Tax=Micromonospora sp. BL4 TaxID=2478710 RepID=UPI000EF5825E|nr:HIT family protein [Micromonospora sp. BL4]RLP94742.1 HIT family protein [Micromonospora sp. BL4]